MFIELDIIFKQIPNLKHKDFSTVDITKESVDLWFESINQANQFDALEQIRSVLENSNQYQLDSEDRIYLLEKLHSPVISLAGHLKPKIIESSLPLTENNKKQIASCIKIYQQLFLAYSIILQQQLKNKKRSWRFLFSLDKRMAYIIQRMIRYLSQIVLTEFEVYCESDTVTWKSLYSLYLFAERKGFSETKVNDPLLNEETTIKTTFLQIILLALSDPYHFNQNQIYFIYKHLAHWAKWVEISSNNSQHRQFNLAVNLSHNYLPTFYPRGHKPEHQNALFIDTHKLSVDLMLEHSDSTNSFISDQIKKDLLLKLQKSWSVYSDRNFDRNDYYTEMKLVIGLKNVHYVLNNYQQPNWLNNAEFTSKTSSLEEPEFQFGDADIEYEQMLDAVTYHSEEKIDKKNLIKNLLTENESLNGLSLIWIDKSPLKIKIGEVVALSHQTSELPNEWFVGVIRRIQQFKTNPLKVGIQILCPAGAEAVEMKSSTQRTLHRAIYLPNFSLSNEDENILVDALTFKSLEKVELIRSNNKEQRSYFQLSDINETTNFYMRFSVDSVNE